MGWETFRAVVFVFPIKAVQDRAPLSWEWPDLWDTGNELLALLLCALSCCFTSENIFISTLSCLHCCTDPTLQGGNATAGSQFQARAVWIPLPLRELLLDLE